MAPSLSYSVLCVICVGLILSSSAQMNDTAALGRFRTETDVHGALTANWTGKNACSPLWWGVRCNNGHVTALCLPTMDLRGSIDALASLDRLHLLDLRGNRLKGSLLPLTKCANLKLLYLSGNDFSGDIPQEIGRLRRLVRLDLSDNNISGELPAGIWNLTRLITLRLQNNVISGKLPDFSAAMPALREFNISDNELIGKVSDGLRRKFGGRSFAGNSGLCGSTPLPICSFSDSLSLPPTNASSTAVGRKGESARHKTLNAGAIVAIVVTDAVLLLVIMSFLVAYYCGWCSGAKEEDRSEKRRKSSGSDISSNGRRAAAGGGDESEERKEQPRSELVFFERRKQFELEDLLKASAEMLGKGSLGTVYRAVLEDGCTVAVKRLRDANPYSRKDFERYMDLVGKLRHPNLVRLRAYYYAKEEKLLVYDYLPNGSLFTLLHGNRGSGRPPLDWTTRIGLVLGAAKGLARIHDEHGVSKIPHGVSKIPHGNVKSSNVLLDKNGVACIADFGLALLLNPAAAAARLGGYRAPEQAEGRKISQKADVYAFGVVVLEVVTGRPAGKPEEEELPQWVRARVRGGLAADVFDEELLRYKNTEEMTAMLQVGLACAAEEAEQRPEMWEVVKMIEEIRVEKSPTAEDFEEFRSSASPSPSTTAEGFSELGATSI